MNQSFLTPIQRFIKAESFSGFLLFATTLLAMLLSNLPSGSTFDAILNYNLGIKAGSFELIKPMILWINDGLMTIFFFLIGLEIKREIVVGELNSIKKASLPIFAAIGGIIAPLIIFLVLNKNPETENGWGMTIATDIAFTLAVLKLLGNKVPIGLKIFLTAFAIIDDIGAVLVIALFYTSNVDWYLILYAGIILTFLYTLSFFKIHNKFILFFSGIIVWFLFLKSGIHPTIAGILLALSIPVHQRINEFQYNNKLKNILNRIVSSQNTSKLPVLTHTQIEELDNLEELTNKVQSPIQQLEHRLHYWVAFLIMPVFALANAGINFSSDMNTDNNLVITIVIALFAGKTIGVSLFSFLSIKFNMAALPENIRMMDIIGIAVLAGVGFTMSLFIGGLAFAGQAIYLNSAKIGIILASVLSGITGFIIIKQSLKKKRAK
ncbi:MAG: Na+/H+ antiporter NhaA [Marinilabiliales bacterium]|nr:MAG: Na+/H+ antiporter NhaA [Marinilabiliales bacterium]